MLNSSVLLVISCWIMLWKKAVFCLEVCIYKHLQMWLRQIMTSSAAMNI